MVSVKLHLCPHCCREEYARIRNSYTRKRSLSTPSKMCDLELHELNSLPQGFLLKQQCKVDFVHFVNTGLIFALASTARIDSQMHPICSPRLFLIVQAACRSPKSRELFGTWQETSRRACVCDRYPRSFVIRRKHLEAALAQADTHFPAV